ncbi:MAG: outer membrane protein assembly factor BamD [Myxococcales bacterium]|jgi:outer membrane protein assembly factor BamD
MRQLRAPDPTRLHAASLVLLLGLGACASGATGSQGYAGDAERAYRDALEQFYDEDCFEAEPMMRNVRREYPYSRFAALADLRVADCQFQEGNYAEAIQTYNQFVRYRPSHVEVPYARFMAARAHYEQIPGEWLLSPPAHERDQYYTQETLRLLRRFMLDFPDDPLIPRARKMAEEAIELLAAHEMYAAGFYYDRGHARAAAGRLRTLLRSYPGSSKEPRALLLLGRSYEQLGDLPRARAAFNALVERYPAGPDADMAREALGMLGS